MNKLYVCFIDYQKASDRGNHEDLINCLIYISTRGRSVASENYFGAK